jgi:hypothetical protein
MNIQEIFNLGGPLAEKAKEFVRTTAVFLDELAKNGQHLDLNSLNNVSTGVDYDAPVLDSYKKQYTPITPGEIMEANKKMSEAIAGEKWVEGFMACVQLVLMAK